MGPGRERCPRANISRRRAAWICRCPPNQPRRSSRIHRLETICQLPDFQFLPPPPPGIFHSRTGAPRNGDARSALPCRTGGVAQIPPHPARRAAGDPPVPIKRVRAPADDRCGSPGGLSTLIMGVPRNPRSPIPRPDGCTGISEPWFLGRIRRKPIEPAVGDRLGRLRSRPARETFQRPVMASTNRGSLASGSQSKSFRPTTRSSMRSWGGASASKAQDPRWRAFVAVPNLHRRQAL